MLLLVAARPRRGSRVGPYVGRQAQTPAIRASFVGSSGNAAMHNRDGCARRQAPPRAKLRHGLGLHRGNRAVRGLDSTTMQEGDRASTSGTETGSTHPARDFLFFRPVPKTARSILFLGTGEKGEPTGRERKPEHVRGSGDRVGSGTEVAKDSGSRTAHEDPRPDRTPSREQLSSYFFVDCS